eukprot:363926-Chlamydomonas_euryale.AAC.1
MPLATPSANGRPAPKEPRLRIRHAKKCECHLPHPPRVAQLKKRQCLRLFPVPRPSLAHLANR